MADYFDDDEKNEPIGFEQDPDDDDFGNGTFIYADGTRKYGSDYDTAKKLDREGKAQVTGPEEDPMAPPAASLAPPPADAEDAVEQQEQAEEAPPLAAPVPRPAPQLMQPPPAARPLPLASQSRNVQQQQSQSQTEQGSQSSTVSRTSSAMPEDVFRQQQADTGAGYDQAIRTADDNRFAEAAAIAARGQQIEQTARDRETATAAAMAQRDQRMAAVTQKYQEVATRKPDPGKIWQDKGILGTLAGALGVIMGGLSAYTMGRENTALKEIQAQKKQNIELQLEDRNSELRQLERELGSLEAAVPVFEARMNDAIKMKLEAGLQDERSQTALRNGAQLMQQLEIEKTAKLGEGLKAFHGTVAQQQAQQSSMSTTAGSQTATSETESRTRGAGGTGNPSLEQILKLDKALESSGFTREQRAEYLKGMGVTPPGGQTAEEFDRASKAKAAAAGDEKFNEQEAKAEGAAQAIKRYGESAGLVRDPKSGEWVVGEGMFPPHVAENLRASSLRGPGAALESTPIANNMEAAREALGRSLSGAGMRDDEVEQQTKLIGGGALTRQQLADRLNAAESLNESKRPRSRREQGNAVPSNWR